MSGPMTAAAVAFREDELPNPATLHLGRLSGPPRTSDEDPWTRPNLQLDGVGKDAAPAFPLAALDPFWGQVIVEMAEGVSAPADYVAMGVLACAGGMLANVRWPLAGPRWAEPPVVWVSVVGSPSTSKSPALSAAMELVRHVEIEMAKDFDLDWRRLETERVAAREQRGLWEGEVKKAAKENRPPPEMPTTAVEPPEMKRPSMRLGDTTIEAAAEAAVHNKRGLLLHRDEISGWIESYDRYSGGGDRQFWIEAYGGRSYAVNRKKGGAVVIPQLSIGVLGGIQPDRLGLITGGSNDGLAPRFLFSWPDKFPEFKISRLAGRLALSAQQGFARLLELAMDRDNEGVLVPKRIPLTVEAVNRLQEFGSRCKKECGDGGGLYASAVGKAAGHALRLACITEHLSWCILDGEPQPTEISEASILTAIALMDEYFLPMARRVFSEASIPDRERHALTLFRWIRKEGLRTFNARIAGRKLGGQLRSAHSMEAACDVLIEEGLIRPAFTRDGDGVGRKAKNYEVNPKVFDGRMA